MKEFLKTLYYIVYPGLFIQTKLTFYTYFLEVYRSGIALPRCFQILSERISDSKLKKSLLRLEKKLLAGDDLKTSIQSEKNVFGVWDCNIIITGEQSGRLEDFLILLKEHYQSKIEMQRTIKGAAFGPILTLVFFMFFFSLIDLKLGGISAYLSATILPLLFFIISGALIIAFYKQLAIKTPLKVFLNQLALNLPLIGALNRDIATSRFGRVFSLLLSAGMDVQHSILLSAQSTDVPSMITKAQIAIDNQSFDAGWAELLHSLPYLNKDYVDGISLAEETGRLDRVSIELANELNKKVEKHLKTVLPILTKVITIPILVFYFFFKIYGMVMTFIVFISDKFSHVVNSGKQF